MEDLQINLYVFLGVLEASLVLFLVALVFIFRSKSLADRLRSLQQRLDRGTEVLEPVSFEQYLREELIRNQELVESAAASQDDASSETIELMTIRKEFLAGEIEARALESNPVEFQHKLAAGLSELVARLRLQAETVVQPLAVEVATELHTDTSTARCQQADTHELEFNRLKKVINNQQDVMTALRRELVMRADGVDALDTIMQRLDEFEQQGAGLQQCLDILDKAHDYLKQARAGVWTARAAVDPADPDQRSRLQSLVDEQQATIANLKELLENLAGVVENGEGVARAVEAVQRSSYELNGCITTMECENDLLRSQLEALQIELDHLQTAVGQQAEPETKGVKRDANPAQIS